MMSSNGGHLGNRGARRQAVAVDLGGTWLKCALVDEDGAVRSSQRIPTPADGRESVLSALRSAIGETGETAGGLPAVDAVGIGSPGMIDGNGYLHGAAVNISGWADFSIAGELERRLGRSVVALNDANAAAMGELRFGAGRGVHDIALVTVGTGIGVGIVIEGRPHAGKGGVAGELGHLVIYPGGRICSCGNRGCIEAYASASGMRSLVRELADGFDDAASELAHAARSVSSDLTSEEIYRRLRSGDPLAAAVNETVCEALAHAAAVLAVTVAPERIVFAGGIMGSADLILPRVRERFERFVLPHVAGSVELTPAGLSSDAGLVGAAAAALAI